MFKLSVCKKGGRFFPAQSLSVRSISPNAADSGTVARWLQRPCRRICTPLCPAVAGAQPRVGAALGPISSGTSPLTSGARALPWAPPLRRNRTNGDDPYRDMTLVLLRKKSNLTSLKHDVYNFAWKTLRFETLKETVLEMFIHNLAALLGEYFPQILTVRRFKIKTYLILFVNFVSIPPCKKVTNEKPSAVRSKLRNPVL